VENANQFNVKDTNQGSAFVQLIEMVLIALYADCKFKAGESACIDKALANLSLVYREGRVILGTPMTRTDYEHVS
jgi:hypothetical protein